MALSQTRAAWTDVVKERVDRLCRGEFAALFDEAAAAAEMAGPRGGQVDQVRRAVELAHLGKASKAFGALTSGGVLPLEQEAVREAFSTFLQPNNESTIVGAILCCNREGQIQGAPSTSSNWESVKSSGPMDR